MAILNIKGTTYTPSVHFDDKTGMLRIAGRSLPRDAVAFYQPLIAWIKAYAKRPALSTQLVLNFEYLDVKSSKLILDVISALKTSAQIKINWHYCNDNEAMKEVGEDLSELSNIPFEYTVSH